VAAERGAADVHRRLNTHSVRTFKNNNLRLIMVAMVIATASLIAALWLLA
jgi:hypothetical protein